MCVSSLFSVKSVSGWARKERNVCSWELHRLNSLSSWWDGALQHPIKEEKSTDRGKKNQSGTVTNLSVQIISDKLIRDSPGRQLAQGVNELRAELSPGLSLSRGMDMSRN